MKFEHKGTTSIIPSIRGQHPALLAVLLSIVNQTRPPNRVLVLDMSQQLSKDRQVVRLCDHFHIEIVEAKRTTTAKAVNKLVDIAKTEWIWILPDDLAPAYDCHEKLLTAAAQWDADLVSGVKLEVVRKDPWGEDWNRMNHPHRGSIVMPWADTANLLVKRKVWLQADTSYDPGEEINGEDVVTTAKIGHLHTIIGCGEAIGFHLPADEHRWATSEGDDNSMQVLSEYTTMYAGWSEHMEWFRRFIKRT